LCGHTEKLNEEGMRRNSDRRNETNKEKRKTMEKDKLMNLMRI
jgi:hypothetical protein